MKNKLIILTLVLLAPLFKKGQVFDKKRNDSLLGIINSPSSPDSVKSFAYLNLAYTAQLNNPHQSLAYINKSIELCDKKRADFLYKRYLEKATVFRILGQIDSGIYYCNIVLQGSLKNRFYNHLHTAYGEFGLISIAQGNFSKATDYFNKQIATIKKHKLKHNISGVYNNIGIAYGNRGDWDMAGEYFKRATRDDIQNNQVEHLGNDYNNIGIVFMVKNQLDSAKKYFQLGLNHRLKVNDLLGVGGSLNNIALLEKDQKNYKKAILYADSAMSLAETNGFKKLQVEVYDSYDQIYSQMGDYKRAYEYLNKKNNINAVFEKEESNNKIQQLESDIQLEQKQTQLLEKDLQLAKSEQQKQKQLSVIIIGAVLFLALLYFLFTFFKNNRVLRDRNGIISHQKQLIEEKHKDITDSINYAQRIQSALIISEEKLNKSLHSSFVVFKPRDIVSGDFYWFTEQKGMKIMALADCTGHGVPGAFMSMIGITLLNQVVNEKGIISPAAILSNLRKEVINALRLNSEGPDERDGMDMAVIAFNEHELFYAGANSPVLLLSGEEIIDLKPNKQPIGFYENQEDFTEQRIEITQNLKVYLFSDGLVDQFGGPDGKKVKTRQFKEWLLKSSKMEIKEQGNYLLSNLENWKKDYEQTDDISLIGIKLK